MDDQPTLGDHGTVEKKYQKLIGSEYKDSKPERAMQVLPWG